MDNLCCRRDFAHAGEEESIILEGDIGGALVLQRKLAISKDDPKVFKIDSSIIAQRVGAGSGGFSRFDLLLQKPFLFTDLAIVCKQSWSFTGVWGLRRPLG